MGSRSGEANGIRRVRLQQRLKPEPLFGPARTLRAVAFDLKTFFTVVGKDPVEVTATELFDFLADQRGDRAVIWLADRESGLSARAIARRLSAVSGLYAYLAARGDTSVAAKPGAARGDDATAGQHGAVTHAGARATNAAEDIVAG